MKFCTFLQSVLCMCAFVCLYGLLNQFCHIYLAIVLEVLNMIFHFPLIASVLYHCCKKYKTNIFKLPKKYLAYYARADLITDRGCAWKYAKSFPVSNIIFCHFHVRRNSFHFRNFFSSFEIK